MARQSSLQFLQQSWEQLEAAAELAWCLAALQAVGMEKLQLPVFLAESLKMRHFSVVPFQALRGSSP